jgi:NADH:ubiquinone oxidoreductase subunit F (NADH-binding)
MHTSISNARSDKINPDMNDSLLTDLEGVPLNEILDGLRSTWPLTCITPNSEGTMIGENELRRIREEHEAYETWRTVSRHVVASLFEVCAVCDAVRDKEHLVRCEGCANVYVCRDGTCARLHEAQAHPVLSRWRS